MFKCPKCGEVIPAEEAEEHMRIELLDPDEQQSEHLYNIRADRVLAQLRDAEPPAIE